jgi:hypothetical protein
MHVPATLRRTGYDFVPAAPRPSPGLCGLPLRQRRVNERFVSAIPARAVAEAVIEAAGGDRFPPRAVRPVVV